MGFTFRRCGGAAGDGEFDHMIVALIAQVGPPAVVDPGGGYPANLKGDAIPLSARIMNICDQ